MIGNDFLQLFDECGMGDVQSSQSTQGKPGSLAFALFDKETWCLGEYEETGSENERRDNLKTKGDSVRG